MTYCSNVTCFALFPCPKHDLAVLADGAAHIFQSFVDHNMPALWEGATEAWGGWDLNRLQSVLGGTEMKNVFVAANGRFTFFKAAQQVEGLKKQPMFFSEFVSRAKKDASFDPILCPEETYYLYGEPLPAPLKTVFTDLPLLQSVRKQYDLTSSLLWVAVNGSCSPLHYDLSEGVLAQIVGTKRVIMFPPSAQLYPFPVVHAHDRQSSIPDVHKVDRRQFPLFDENLAVRGELKAGQVLYIPFGWWHQIESEGVNVSVSFRWNPFETSVRKLTLGLRSVSMLPPAARSLIQAQLLKDVGPPHVQAIYKVRFSI